MTSLPWPVIGKTIERSKCSATQAAHRLWPAPSSLVLRSQTILMILNVHNYLRSQRELSPIHNLSAPLVCQQHLR